MTSKDKKAIKSLVRLKDKLKDRKNFNDGWVSSLVDIFAKYLGTDSQLYKNAESWYSYAERENDSHINKCKELIDNAIEFVEDNGTNKDRTFWKYIEDMNQNVLYAIITAILSCVFYGGHWVGENNISKDIVQVNNKLDSILRILTFNKPEKTTNPDTNRSITENNKEITPIIAKTDSIHK